MRPLIDYIKHPLSIVDVLTRQCASFIPDKLYLSLLYRCRMDRWINWKNPQTFTEKIQWLKLHRKKPEYTTMVDKYSVKDYVSGIIGSEYVIPTLGVWSKPEDIDFDALPDKFVLKTTHGGGGGGVIICSDRSIFDIEVARRKLNRSLKSDIYKYYREWPYKNVPRRIIAEKYIEIPDKNNLIDYKFFCFNGVPRFLKVDFDRFVDHHANYYDLDWNLLPFGEADMPPVESHVEHCPPNFDKMIAIAYKLSKGHSFLRVDLYNVAGRIYFGELTFYPASGLGAFTSDIWDEKIGYMLDLNQPIG